MDILANRIWIAVEKSGDVWRGHSAIFLPIVCPARLEVMYMTIKNLRHIPNPPILPADRTITHIDVNICVEYSKEKKIAPRKIFLKSRIIFLTILY